MSFLTTKKPKRIGRSDFFNDEMTRWFENFFEDERFPMRSNLAGSFTPSIDVSETDKAYKVKAELPGLEEDDVELVFQDNTLFLKGEKKLEKEEEKEDYHYKESSYGSFHRTIPFSTRIDEEKVSAQFKKGVLTITLEKSPEAVKKTRRISIN